jgi:putative ABC transport system substrate-binding protein
MRRREFITLLGGAAATWPLAVRAQQAAMPVVGFLSVGSPDYFAPFVAAFNQGLKATGYIDGQNVKIEYQWADNQYDRLLALAKDLASRQVAVIAANGGSRSALAAKAVTKTIPIVFTFGDGDPVKHGLVESLNHPGRNITGVTMIASTLEPKRLEFLREMVPKMTAIHILINPNNGGVAQDIPNVAAVAGKLGLKFDVVKASTESEIDAAFATMARQHAQALMVASDNFLSARASQIASLAARYSIPAIYAWREFTAAGGLMSYGTSIAEAYRQSGLYVGHILKGTKPGDIPVQEPTKFELVINAKTAKALGIEVPLSLQVRADEVID